MPLHHTRIRHAACASGQHVPARSGHSTTSCAAGGQERDEQAGRSVEDLRASLRTAHQHRQHLLESNCLLSAAARSVIFPQAGSWCRP